jgi:hypothetical protein
MLCQLKSGGYGLGCGAQPPEVASRAGNSRAVSAVFVREATVKVYGVAVAKPQG